MSTTLPKTDLVRSAWITELRRQGDRQCTGDYRKGKNVCALGLLREVMGFGSNWESEWVERATGLEHWMACEVVAMNDGQDGYPKHTFSEIADVVESWFSKAG